MKFFLILSVSIILVSCSFDNKSGIWKNNNQLSKEKDNLKEFQNLYTQSKSFNKIIEPKKKLNILLDPIISTSTWTDIYFNNLNKLDNFKYENYNQLVYKSKKITKYETSNRILYENQNIICSDKKGNVIVFSLSEEKQIFKYNFYKKNYKKIAKNLSLIVENNIIYVGDNFGYIYALDYVKDKLLWAKNFKTPFRSNLKIQGNNLVIADINNALYFINKNNGDKFKVLPTEETLIKNEFINTLISTNKDIFFLNTYGSLYSVNKNGKINWFSNLNQSSDINPTNLFNARPILLHNDKIIVSTDKYLYVLNSNTGSTELKIVISSKIMPLLSGKNLFLVTKDNLLVYIDIIDKKIIYSINLDQKISKFLEIKEKQIKNIKSFILANNSIYIFLDNSYYLKLTPYGTIKKIDKLSSQMKSFPIFIKDKVIYLNKKKKLVIIN